MKSGTLIETPRLVLRPWTASEGDRAAFHRLNSDEQVMRFFPYRLTRPEADARLDGIMARTAADGFGWGTALLRESGENIGFVGVARTSLDGLFGDAVEIGWRFLPEAWGKGYATETATALLAHGFSDLGLAEILAFVAEGNTASQAVMRRPVAVLIPTLSLLLLLGSPFQHAQISSPDASLTLGQGMSAFASSE